jgi:class 3 adenylate cyclase
MHRRATFPTMRALLRSLVLFLCLSSAGYTAAQDDPPEGRVDLRRLSESTTRVSGMGTEVPGLDLASMADMRHWIGDDSSFAFRQLVDSTWLGPRKGLDSIVSGVGVHWVRYHLEPQPDVQHRPLWLVVQSAVPFVLYHNGVEVLRSVGLPESPGERVLTRERTLVPVTLPWRPAHDGRPEVLALRLEAPPGTSFRQLDLRATLHLSDAGYHMQRSLMHHGLFIGVNTIIVLLALIIWWNDRNERSWLLLALLSLVNALSTFTDLAGNQRVLGFGPELTRLLDDVDSLMMAWPTYLLIMVLATMHGGLTRRMTVLYTTGVLVVTLTVVAVLVMRGFGLVDLTDGFVLEDSDMTVTVLLVLMVMGLLFGVSLAIFAVEVVRHGIKLLRMPGYERWLGAGAVISSLLSIAFQVVGELAGVALFDWFGTIAEYCSYVAVPVSAAVYLAIRSAHHNRLVARQRDDLDAEVKERTAELRAERDRSDELLLNILPQEVADELKAKGSAAARHFDQATVLFTDFRGFTQLSEQVGPAELVQELNACFKAFDAIMDTYRIEKIKTIGDSYMAAGGLPDPTHGGPADVVFAALEMQDFMEKHKAERMAAGKPYFEMRVGIHSGPVVAGIVGVKKFQYDIWGDTVNTASRMESSGEIGKVNISGATYDLVKAIPGVTFTPRGKVQAKGKGEMEMFFVSRGSEAV